MTGLAATRPGTRGYFGIGVEGVSKSANVGALLRTAHAFGAAFCFSVGAGWDARAARTADTAETPTHVPLWRFPDLGKLALPQGCVLVGVELLDDAVDLPSFHHPLNAAYVLGPERAGLSPAMLARCRHVVRVPTRFALNLAVVGALVLYDRLLQHGRFADRPVGSAVGSTLEGGTLGSGASDGVAGNTCGSARVPAAPDTAGHGAPRFRRTLPDWLKTTADADK
ncbi:MAG TPA: TrmH family RNA methyltransferase [Acetobacteraceae bacterium]|jgi:tRNA(Leu) C34 or U34 (ribose-2'-O)-methylase TrmL|nr:TrmH family RNA methyltransferase [Acetobacteraceae bacterium]